MNKRPLMFATRAVAILTVAACSAPGSDTAEANMSEEVLLEQEMPAKEPAASTPVVVGGAEMFPTKTIVENASQSADHTTLVAAVKAAELVETLSGAGPFTVFAPTNAAFAKLSAGTVDGLLKPESKDALEGILTYHVVPGRMTAADLSKAIDGAGGTAKLTTAAGGTLTATKSGSTITLKDAKGGTSTVSQADVMQSNGVVHVVDTVLLPS